MGKPTITAHILEEQFVWLKDHSEKTRAQHLRDALAQYIRNYGKAVTEHTKVTIATPDGPKPYRLKVKPAEYDFTPEAPREIDPSTGEPIE